MKPGCPYGSHRVLEPPGSLPQPAWKLDNSSEIYDNEILVDVMMLNVDSASFTQIKNQGNHDPEQVKDIIIKIVADRGKLHNPVTGSGGMFIGRIKALGEKIKSVRDLNVGDLIASLVSLSLTPLNIRKIKKVNMASDQVEVEAEAVLFESGLYAKLPLDIPQNLALAVLDVAGAPAQTARLVKPGEIVFIVGAGGKAGLLCLYEARKRTGVSGKVIGLAYSDEDVKRMQQLGCADEILQLDATNALTVMQELERVTNGAMADVTINVVNVPGTELGSILATRDGGTVYFFSMATSFTAAALGAEGAGKDVTMVIGNGYTRGHAEITLELLRESQALREMFERLYA